MKTIFTLCIVFCLSHLMGCSTAEEQQDPIPKVSPIVGDWIIEHWYCDNVDNCSPYYQDKNAFLVFTVTDIDAEGNIDVTEIEYRSLLCDENPDLLHCPDDPTWTANTATFIDNILYLDITPTGFPSLHTIISGYMANGDIMLDVWYESDNGDFGYLQNGNLIATKIE